MNDEIIFTEGMFFNEPSQKAPDFIKGSLSIEPKQFTDWLRKNYNKNEKYIRIDLKISKAGKAYSCLSTFKPNQGGQSHNNVAQTSYNTSQGNNNQGQSTQRQSKDDFEDDFPF